MHTDDKLIALLADYWRTLTESLKTLESSFQKCSRFDLINGNMSEVESDALDALTSKFARSSDLFTQKVLNSILKIKRADASTFVDKMNNCEKAGIIASAEEMIKIRDLRNEIAHEYWLDQLREQQALTLETIPLLFRNIEVSGDYLTRESLL